MANRKAVKSDWKAKPMPEAHVVIPMHKELNAEDLAIVAQGAVPGSMDEKWFIYLEDDRLFMHRSWTGNCIFILEVETSVNGALLKSIAVNRKPEEYGGDDDEYDVALANWVIDRLMLNRNVSLPRKGQS